MCDLLIPRGVTNSQDIETGVINLPPPPPHTHTLLADVMSDQGAEKIIAVDVGSQDNNDLTNYGDHISGWYILWNKINPLARKIRVSLFPLYTPC